MSENTKIEWCDHTFNPWEGCQKVGLGCDHCYAETRNARFGGGTAPNFGPGAPRRRTSAANWALPKRWNAQADAFMAQHGRRQRVFCASLADVFDNAVDPQWRADLFELIAATPNLDWLLLTKRIGNVPAMISIIPGHLPSNVWLGATIVNQPEADRDITKLLAVPAAKRFLSMEPLLGPVDLTRDIGGTLWIGGQRGCGGTHRHGGDPAGHDHGGSSAWVTGDPRAEHHHHDNRCRRGIDWVIVGGESGPGARPMHPDWARSLRDQCEAAGVPFLFKQWGSWTLHEVHNGGEVSPPMPMNFTGLRLWNGEAWESPAPDTPASMVFRDGATLAMPANKKAAGRHLDGRTWDGFPP